MAEKSDLTAEDIARRLNPMYRPGEEGISAFMGYKGAKERWKGRRQSTNILDMRGQDMTDYNRTVLLKLWIQKKKPITRDQFSDRFDGNLRLMQTMSNLQRIIGVK